MEDLRTPASVKHSKHTRQVPQKELQYIQVDVRQLTTSVGAPPCLRRVLVQISASSTVAPVDVGRLPGQACPGHATLIPVHRDVSAPQTGSLLSMRHIMNGALK